MTGSLLAIEADGVMLGLIRSLQTPQPLTVAAVYTHAVYTRFGSRFMVLLTQNEPVGPTSAVISVPRFDPSWNEGGWIDADILAIGPYVISWKQVLAYWTELAAIPAWDHRALVQAIRKVWPHGDVLEHIRDRFLYNRLHTEVNLLLDALKHQDNVAIERLLKALIGLGSGSTPAGDDILLGLMVGLSLSHPSWAERLRRSIPGPEELERLTTLPSVVALSEASAGRVFSLMNETVRWLGCPHPSEEQEFQRLITRGHTSGKDMVAGLVMGLMAPSA